MIPEECASMRSMARCVLPVLVGPSTAVTPAPRAPVPRLFEGEKEMGIKGRKPAQELMLLPRDAVCQPAAGAVKRARIMDDRSRGLIDCCHGFQPRPDPHLQFAGVRYMLPRAPANAPASVTSGIT